ncbi:MAG: antibiotic transporter permease [Frondihabitans sp.]|nr:antibiotic transporter permease [Frondihabitans sp.]
MNAALTLATALRVLQQIRHDPRTVALLLVVPTLLIGLMAWIFNDQALFDAVGPDLLGLFPFIMMFLITSITTLRERRSGTLERLMTMPLGRFDFIGGYALAFGLLAIAQSLISVGFAVWVCGLDVRGSAWLLVLVAGANALLGTALGLFTSAFASSEFQVVQFMPALVFPQVLLGGIFVPRDRMPDVLQILSDWLPLTHGIDAFQQATATTDTGSVLREVAIVLAWVIAFVALGSITLRRRTS